MNNCPFCDSDKSYIMGGMVSSFYVECPVCSSNGPVAKTEKQAIDLWNNTNRQEVLYFYCIVFDADKNKTHGTIKAKEISTEEEYETLVKRLATKFDTIWFEVISLNKL